MPKHKGYVKGFTMHQFFHGVQNTESTFEYIWNERKFFPESLETFQPLLSGSLKSMQFDSLGHMH